MAPSVPSLIAGNVYSHAELARNYGFATGYFNSAGGMPVSSATGTQLCITHPTGGKTFNYGDYWHQGDLIYTGRGQSGDQQLTGPNAAVGNNSRTIHVFEAAGPGQLRFLGEPTCIGTSTSQAPDRDGNLRTVLLFRLRFPAGQGESKTAGTTATTGASTPADGALGTARAFDPTAAPISPATGQKGDPEQIAQAQEQAVAGHHNLLVALNAALIAAGWQQIEEVPGGYDLRSVAPSGQRVIFEAKTVTAANALSQCRSGLAQLLEYRIEYGDPADQLCLVLNSPISIRRRKVLDEMAVSALVWDGTGFDAGNAQAQTAAVNQLL